MRKEWYKSKTVLSAVAWLLAQAAESMGAGGVATSVVENLSIGGIIYGFRDAMQS